MPRKTVMAGIIATLAVLAVCGGLMYGYVNAKNSINTLEVSEANLKSIRFMVANQPEVAVTITATISNQGSTPVTLKNTDFEVYVDTLQLKPSKETPITTITIGPHSTKEVTFKIYIPREEWRLYKQMYEVMRDKIANVTVKVRGSIPVNVYGISFGEESKTLKYSKIVNVNTQAALMAASPNQGVGASPYGIPPLTSARNLEEEYGVKIVHLKWEINGKTTNTVEWGQEVHAVLTLQAVKNVQGKVLGVCVERDIAANPDAPERCVTVNISLKKGEQMVVDIPFKATPQSKKLKAFTKGFYVDMGTPGCWDYIPIMNSSANVGQAKVTVISGNTQTTKPITGRTFGCFSKEIYEVPGQYSLKLKTQ